MKKPHIEEPSTPGLTGLRNLIERITPWLFAVGSWIFGGLLAFNLVAVSSLIAVGPVDAAVLMSITAFACALPLNVAGIVLLRLVDDMKAIGIDEVTLKAFQDAGFPDIDAYFPPSEERASLHKRRSQVALRYALGIVLVSIALTLAGLTAALWHMAWWTGVVFSAMVVFSTVLVVLVIAHSLPPESDAEKELKRRHG